MGLSYHFTFSAPESTTAAELEDFLREVELEAQEMDFNPTSVINGPFDTAERRSFARRITSGYYFEGKDLFKGGSPSKNEVWDYGSDGGWCRLAPEKAVFLVVTDESQAETVFGFVTYTEVVHDHVGNVLVKSPLGKRWYFRNFVDTPDPRFRKIVKLFAERGFVEFEEDEYLLK